MDRGKRLNEPGVVGLETVLGWLTDETWNGKTRSSSPDDPAMHGQGCPREPSRLLGHSVDDFDIHLVEKRLKFRIVRWKRRLIEAVNNLFDEFFVLRQASPLVPVL